MKFFYKILPSFLLFLSLVFLRHQLVLEMHLDYSQALKLGLYVGWIYDLAAVLVVGLGCQLLWGLFLIPQKILWPLGATLLWVSNLANVLHFRFFKTHLEWWIVQLHWQDLTMVADSSLALANLPSILASGVFFLASLLLVFTPFVSLTRFSPSRIKTILLAMGGFILIYQLANYPVWHGFARINFLNEQILKVWTKEWVGKSRSFFNPNAEDAAQWELIDRDRIKPILFSYKNYTDAVWQKNGTASPVLPASRKFEPFESTDSFASHSQLTQELRQEFGFPLEGEINVIVLFVESWRIFEVEHPEIGEHVFPKLRSILHQKSLYFPQAYSSSLTAGQTVRGQFSTLCSTLPNITGPAVYHAYPHIKVRCLAALFQEKGYRTLWMNSYFASFHNTERFESLHGTQEFYDQKYFMAQGLTQKVGHWGLADKPFLEEALKVLQSSQGQPFFANLLTANTHHPFPRISPVYPLPAHLIQQVGEEHSEYLDYLFTLRYADEALSNFIEKFFASPLADRTLLVILGDHSIPLEPHLALSPVQRQELQFRIPIALISKHLKHPRRIPYPVHQIDVAPTIARIAGIFGGGG